MLTFAVLTCSDSRTIETDEAGRSLIEAIESKGWSCVKHAVVADEQSEIEEALCAACDKEKVDVVLTCGGTGFSTRDVTPEATQAVCDRMAPGLAEAIRMKSLAVTERAMLSRASSGLRGMSLIVNFPGSKKAAMEAFGFVSDQFEHGIEMLHGGGH